MNHDSLKILHLFRETGPQNPYLAYISHLFSKPYLDDVLPDDHLARLLWQALEEVDLSGFYASLIVKPNRPGRGAADPRLMVALWLYATSEGVTSARELGRLCREHLAYIWLCGGVSINYHSLSDGRTQHGQALDQLRDLRINKLPPRRSKATCYSHSQLW